MTRLASGNSLIRAQELHAFRELPFVRIRVTIRATQVLPVIDNSRLRLELCRLLVAVDARDRDVSPGKNEVRLFVTVQRKCGRFIPFQIVAAVTGVGIRSRDKLPGVTVAVAISAIRKLDLEQSFLALWNVALAAFHSGVPALQRIGARSMFLHGERRWLPPIHVVA